VPTAGSPVTITTGAAAGDEQYFFSDNPAYSVGTAANGQVYLTCGTVLYPAYLAGADETVTNNWVNWAWRYGANTNAAYESCFLLDISPATAIPHGAALLRVVHFKQTDTGYRFELASDIAELTKPADADGNRLGNGYIAVDVTAVLSEAWCRVAASAIVDANGHAIVDVARGDVVLELWYGGYAPYLNSDSYFFRPVLTPVQPVKSSLPFRPHPSFPGWE
jgi:hypothetical protein